MKLTPEQKRAVKIAEARQKMFNRNEKIRDMYETGKYSHRTLAKKVGLSKSRIGEILY